MVEYELDSLIKTIERDGLRKGEEQGQRVIGEAQARAKRIIDDAQRQAGKIREEAAREIEQRRQSTEKLLEHAVENALRLVSQRIGELLRGLLEQEVKKTLTARDLAEIIIQVYSTAIGKAFTSQKYTLTVAEAQEREIIEYLTARLQEESLKGLTIVTDARLENGIRISSDDNGLNYEITREALVGVLGAVLPAHLGELIGKMSADGKAGESEDAVENKRPAGPRAGKKK